MTRNLKALGLALMAAFALSAVGATAAQALEADVGAGGQTITGNQLNESAPHNNHSFVLSSGRAFACSTAVFDGTIENGDTEVTVTPTYSGCLSNGTQPATVTHNGCDYRFYNGEEESPNNFTNVTVDLECDPGNVIEVHVYSSHANHTSGTVLCTYNVAPFVGEHNNTLSNTGSAPDDVKVVSTVEGIAVTRVTGSALVCGNASQTATYTGVTTLRAYSDTAHEDQVDLTVTE